MGDEPDGIEGSGEELFSIGQLVELSLNSVVGLTELRTFEVEKGSGRRGSSGAN